MTHKQTPTTDHGMKKATGITRKGFLGTLAGALCAPAAGESICPAHREMHRKLDAVLSTGYKRAVQGAIDSVDVLYELCERKGLLGS